MIAPNSRTRVALVAAAQILLWLVACGGAEEEAAPPAAPTSADLSALAIAEEDLVAGPRDGRLYVMVDLFPHSARLEGESDANIASILTRTATRCAKSLLESEEWRGFESAEVEFIYVPSVDEYGDKDFSNTIEHGSIELRRGAGGALAVAADELRFQKGKVEVREGEPRRTPSGDVEHLDRYGEPEDLSEQILYDELDFFDHPAFLADTYPAFSPERIRRIDSDYFFRFSPEPGGHSGSRYGELVLQAERGSLLYLPRDVSSTGVAQIAFRYRKSDPADRVFLRIYHRMGRVATVREGDVPGFPGAGDGEWHRVTVPSSALRFHAPAEAMPERKKLRDPFLNLQYLSPRAGRVFAIEIGLEGAPSHTLHFDRLAFLRREPATRRLRGEVVPAVAGVEIQVNTPDQRLTTSTDAAGRFALELPARATRYEVIARHENLWYLPSAGRYFELSSYAPPVRIAIGNRKLDRFAARLHRHRVATSERGTHYLPDSYVLFSEDWKPPEQQEFMTESYANDFGFTDRDRRYVNPDGLYRLVIAGGSEVDSRQVDSQDLMTSQVEAIFRFRGIAMEFIPLGANANALTQAWTSIERHAFRFEPDLVLLSVMHPAQILLGDLAFRSATQKFDPDHPQADFFELDEASGGLIRIAFDPSWTLHRLRGDGRLSPEEIRTAYDRWTRELDREGVEISSLPPDIRRRVRTFAKTLEMMVAEGARRDVAVGLALTTPHEHFRALMAGIARAAGAVVVDTRRVMAEKAVDAAGSSIHTWRHAGHLSPAGHRFLAEAIVDYLSANVPELASAGRS